MRQRKRLKRLEQLSGCVIVEASWLGSGHIALRLEGTSARITISGSPGGYCDKHIAGDMRRAVKGK